MLSQSQCSGSFTVFVLVFVMFLYCILYCHVFGKVTTFVYRLTLCSRILKYFCYGGLKFHSADDILLQVFIIDRGNCNMYSDVEKL